MKTQSIEKLIVKFNQCADGFFTDTVSESRLNSVCGVGVWINNSKLGCGCSGSTLMYAFSLCQ